MTPPRMLLPAVTALSLALCGSVGGAETLDALLDRLGRTLGDLRTIETSFVQEKSLRILAQPMVIRGRVYMAKPDRLAWHVDDPIRYTLLMDGKTVRQWDAESDRETRVSLSANPALQVATDQMRQWFSGDYGRLRTAYDVTLASAEPATLVFIPLPGNPASGHIAQVTVVFTSDERYLASIEIVEREGDRTSIRFGSTVLDGELPAAAWDLRSEAASE